MPRKARELSAKEVRDLRHPGGRGNVTFAVGGVSGLLLQVTPTGARTWILRKAIGARRREIGLGGFPDVSLAQARERARETLEDIRRGVDPIEERKAARAALVAAQGRGITFEKAMKKYFVAKDAEFQSEKHRKQWQNSLDAYAVPVLGAMLVSDIKVQDVQRALVPIWETKTETASRLRGRIEAILAWATVQGHRSGDNPARWRGNLESILPKPARLQKKGNFPAVALEEAADWFTDLRTREGMGARALECVAMLALRSGEVRGATWDEIDFKGRIWEIPAARMKAKKPHRVPLTEEAVALLASLPRMEGSPYVFPAVRGGMLSDMTLSATMRRMHAAKVAQDGRGYLDARSGRPAVPHGLRSTFRDWAAERTNYPGEMAEIALAHKVSNAVEAAYRRGDQIEKRRAMMAAWGRFLRGEVPAKVVQMEGAR